MPRPAQYTLLRAGALAGALSLLPGCFLLGGAAGSGTAATETRQVEAFSEIDVGGNFQVEVEVGPAQQVTVEADDNLLALIETNVSGETLKIRTSKSVRTKVEPKITITVPSLRMVEASGASKVEASGLAGDAFELEASGASRIVLSGAVEELEIDVSGAGDVDAEDLQTKQADVDVSGAGDVDVTVSDVLDVDISGAGSVSYAGEPTLTEDVSGAGKVKRR